MKYETKYKISFQRKTCENVVCKIATVLLRSPYVNGSSPWSVDPVSEMTDGQAIDSACTEIYHNFCQIYLICYPIIGTVAPVSWRRDWLCILQIPDNGNHILASSCWLCDMPFYGRLYDIDPSHVKTEWTTRAPSGDEYYLHSIIAGLCAIYLAPRKRGCQEDKETDWFQHDSISVSVFKRFMTTLWHGSVFRITRVPVNSPLNGSAIRGYL